MNRNTIIPVFFACDNQYTKYTMVAMKSMIENASKEYTYHMHILHTDVSAAMQERVKELENANTRIYFDDVTERLAKLDGELPVRDYYSHTTYYRLFIPDMYPQYDKAIYIDSDTITIGDISKLYEQNVDGYYVAGVRDQVVIQDETFGEYVEKVLGLDRHAYFNAGMLLINCKVFREENLLQKFIQLLNTYTFVVAQDQDYLNIICKDQVLWLDASWNTEVFGELPCKEEDIQILHYNMASKPWHYEGFRLSEHFWKYAQMTSFYEQIRQELVDYTEEDKAKDRYSGEHLLELALREIQNENNYLNMMKKSNQQSAERLEILERIARLEREGHFDIDVENDPPSRTLMPEEVEYIHKTLGAKLRNRYAHKMGRWFMNMLIRRKQMIIKDVVGIENFKNLEQGAIITCNHFNAFDSFAIQVAYDRSEHKERKFYRVIKEGNYTSFPGFFGYLMRNCNTLPLSSNFATMKKFVKAVDELLQEGNFVLFYPEQSMWWNYRKPKPLKKGAYTFAVNNQVPVLPCFITMQDSNLLDQDGFPIQEYTIHISKPIYPDASLKHSENVESMRRANYEVWKEIYEKTYGIPLEYTCGPVDENGHPINAIMQACDEQEYAKKAE